MKFYSKTRHHPLTSEAENEDGVFIMNNYKTAVITDGLGGHEGKHYPTLWTQQYLTEYDKQYQPVNQDMDWGLSLVSKLRKHLIVSRKNSEYPIASCTIVLSWIYDKQLYVIWTGDSRAYGIKENGNIIRLTDDHDLIYNGLAYGRLTRSEAEKAWYSAEYAHTPSEAWKIGGSWGKKLFKKRHLMYSELSDGPIGHRAFDLQIDNPYQKVLLTTDGIHDNLTRDEIQEVIQEYPEEQVVEKLLEKAKQVMDTQEYGKPDDHSAIFITL